jgi:hypothetical protein
MIFGHRESVSTPFHGIAEIGRSKCHGRNEKEYRQEFHTKFKMTHAALAALALSLVGHFQMPSFVRPS